MSSPVENIKDRLNIVDVVSSYLKLEKAGSNYKARCPFHSEKSASFFVSPSRQTFHCFGCNAGGDMFTFVQDIEGIDFRGALKVLADRAGVELTDIAPKDKSLKELLFRVVETATKYFERNLSTDKDAQEYVRSRGITDDTIRAFRIGFAKNEWEDLTPFFTDKKVPAKIVEKVGLAVVSEKKGGYYDRFRGRIMFPISDSSGRVVGFSGRILPKYAAEEGAAQAKYINSPETPLYDKSRILYGFDKAKLAIRKANACVIVEGQMDIVLSHQAGVENTVAVSGTALTADHLRLIKRLADTIIFAFDADEAGFSASRRGVDLALSMGFDVRIARLPGGVDPADIILRDPEEWKKIIEQAVHVVNFVLDTLYEQIEDKRALQLKVSEMVLPYVARIGNSMEQAHFVSLVAGRLGIAEDAVWKELQKHERAVEGSSAEESRVEERIIEHSFIQKIVDKIAGILLWQGEQEKPLFDVVEYENQLKTILGEEEFKEAYSTKTEDEKKEKVFEAEVYYEGAETLEKEIRDLLVNLEREKLKEKFAALMILLKQAEQNGDSNKAMELLKECQDISKKLGEIVNT